MGHSATEKKINKAGNVRINVNSEARSCNNCYGGKAINVTYSGCVSVALIIQHVMCVGRSRLSSVTCLALPCFSTLNHRRQESEKKLLEPIICGLILSATLV